jgi:two-component system response regulator
MMKSPFTILVVDDCPEDVYIAKRAISKCGYNAKVETAFDGREAINFFERDALPDLILLDLKIHGGIEGLDILRFLKGREQTQNIPVVVVSSSTIDQDITKSFDAGAHKYLHKSADFAEFTKNLRDTIDSIVDSQSTKETLHG